MAPKITSSPNPLTFSLDFLRQQYGVICGITRALDKGLCSWPDLLSDALLVPQRTGNGLLEVLGIQLKLFIFPPFPRQ